MALASSGASTAPHLPLLLAEHAAHALAPWADRLREAGHEVTVATGATAVRAQIDSHIFGAIVLDACLASGGPTDWQAVVRAVDADVPLLLLAHDGSCETTEGNRALCVRRIDSPPKEGRAALEAIREAISLHGAARSERAHAGQNHLAAMPSGARDLLESQFESAKRSLWMAYQPIVDGQQKTTYGFEALVRSQEQSLGSPNLLFDAAEKLGGLFALGRRIRDQVAHDLRAQRLPDGCYLFVNLHARDLLDDELYDVRAPLSQHAERVVFEITERTSLDAIADAQQRLERLKVLGFRLAIDDLGAGFAGLSTMATLDPNVVKLDMSLTRGVDVEPRKRAIIAAMASLCRELSMVMVVEGVETEAEYRALLGCGCRHLQGYWFGRPLQGFVAGQYPITA